MFIVQFVHLSLRELSSQKQISFEHCAYSNLRKCICQKLTALTFQRALFGVGKNQKNETSIL